MKRFAYMTIALLSLSLPAQAEIQTAAGIPIIHDAGETSSILHYYHVLKSSINRTPSTTRHPTQLRLSDILPVRTPAMTPGRVAFRSISELPLVERPLFLVGSDRMSRQWLLEHRVQLRELNAVGMAVEVPGPREYETLVDLANGLPIIPVSGQSLAESLKLSHYPVLISHRGIEQ